MATLLTKARDVLPGRSGSKSSSPSDRSIPPEPVQQNPHGDFRIAERAPALQTLNLARANKSCSGLNWDEQLGNEAQRWADELASRGGPPPAVVSTDHAGEQGEVVFVGRADEADVTFEDAVKDWLGEEKKYDGEVIGQGDHNVWGRYTQCMWSESKNIGIGKAQAGNGKWYVVGRFSPPGNIKGEKPF